MLVEMHLNFTCGECILVQKCYTTITKIEFWHTENVPTNHFVESAIEVFGTITSYINK